MEKFSFTTYQLTTIHPLQRMDGRTTTTDDNPTISSTVTSVEKANNTVVNYLALSALCYFSFCFAKQSLIVNTGPYSDNTC